MIIASLEREDRDNYFLSERMQALKILITIIEKTPESFPLAFARSLVAIASYKEESSIYRVCLDILRKLCVVNPKVVAQAQGIRVMFEAVLDPDCKDLAESIMVSLLHVLNKPKSR